MQDGSSLHEAGVIDRFPSGESAAKAMHDARAALDLLLKGWRIALGCCSHKPQTCCTC